MCYPFKEAVQSHPVSMYLSTMSVVSYSAPGVQKFCSAYSSRPGVMPTFIIHSGVQECNMVILVFLSVLVLTG